MRRGIIVLTIFGALALASVALAATAGTYSGTSKLRIDGITATHPFSLVVKHGKVTKVSLLAGSNCEVLNASSGKKVSFKIKNNSFSGKLKFGAGQYVNITGHFSGHKVSGSFKGKAKGLTASCQVPKNTFSAKRRGGTGLPGSY